MKLDQGQKWYFSSLLSCAGYSPILPPSSLAWADCSHRFKTEPRLEAAYSYVRLPINLL